jgi:hypothetical protein
MSLMLLAILLAVGAAGWLWVRGWRFLMAVVAGYWDLQHWDCDPLEPMSLCDRCFVSTPLKQHTLPHFSRTNPVEIEPN